MISIILIGCAKKISVVKQLSTVQAGQAADSTDCLIFRQTPQHHIVINSLEIKTHSPAVCLSGIFNVTDR